MKRFILFLSSTLVLTCAVFAQGTGSSQNVDKRVVLSGTVYDINGSVIPLGHVVARSYEGKEYQATTNDQGIYRFELPLGLYKIEASASGFCPKRFQLVRVRTGSTPIRNPLDFVLEVAESGRPCKQATMIEKEPKKPGPKIRKPEIFRSIAD